MNRVILAFGKVHKVLHDTLNTFLSKKTKQFEQQYEEQFDESPSVVRIRKFRRDYVLRQSLLIFMFFTILFFIFTN